MVDGDGEGRPQPLGGGERVDETPVPMAAILLLLFAFGIKLFALLGVSARRGSRENVLLGEEGLEVVELNLVTDDFVCEGRRDTAGLDEE